MLVKLLKRSPDGPYWNIQDNVPMPMVLTDDVPEIEFDQTGSRDVNMDFDIVDIHPKENLIDIIRKNLFKKQIKVCIGNKEFKCSLQVLKAYAIYFRTVHERETHVVLDSDKITPEAFDLVYKWMCSKEIDIETELIPKIVDAAKHLVIPDILRQLVKGDVFDYTQTDCSMY